MAEFFHSLRGARGDLTGLIGKQPGNISLKVCLCLKKYSIP
jgi:hypothetical protein